MSIRIHLASEEKKYASCIQVGIFEGGILTETAKKIDKITDHYISGLIKQGRFSGKIGQSLPLFHLPNMPIECLVLVGCGKEKTLSPTQFRKIIIQSMKAFNTLRFTQATSYLTELPLEKKSLPWKIRLYTEAVHEALYKFDLFKTEKEPVSELKVLTLSLPPKEDLDACHAALQEGLAIAEGVVLAKNLGNLPSNVCTPHFLAEQAKALAKQYKTLNLHILNEKEMQKLGMGALLAVSQGSAEEAKLICLEYKGTTKKQAPIALVGKGITFDTGGNSLKPADNMVGMKYDMCGAATVLGVFKAVAELALPLNLVGIIPAAENMPGGTAYKPEDIITSLSGQTIEVISTDAEGRLILADALTYCERYQPEVVIDIATLTGAVVIALGTHATGLLSNHPPLAAALLQAGKDSHDRAWELPLWEEYQEQIKSPFADMSNVGGRMAGAITAGCFLSRFAKKFHWAHLDVAGTAAMMMGASERLATGRPVPLLVQYLLTHATKS